MITVVRLARPLTAQVPSARKWAHYCVSEIVCACFTVALAVPLTIALATPAATRQNSALALRSNPPEVVMIQVVRHPLSRPLT
jgi:hypothetical protein